MYDLMIIGAGPGGYVAAERAGEAGLKTVMFEKNAIGGVCLNEGCIPSKTLLNSGKLYRHAKESQAFGVTAEHVELDQANIVKRKNKVVKKLIGGIKMRMKHAGVDVVNEAAEILPRDGEVLRVAAGGEVYEGKHLIIATGSEAAVPPIEGVREALGKTVITNREILDLPQIPERLTVIGGGVIGLEMACYYQAAGSEVTVIEMLDHIAGPVDPAIGRVLMEVYKKRGMTFHLGATVKKVEGTTVIFEKEGETTQVPGDIILLSTGRTPVTQGFGLEHLNLDMNRRAIHVNRYGETSEPNVYAIGDVVGGAMLAHVASREGEVAVNHILGKADENRTDAIPSVIYTDPEVAWVGLTEAEMNAAGRPCRTVEIPLGYAGRYVAETERGTGICRIVLHADDTLAGVHLICPYASEMILAFGVMIHQKMTLDEMKTIIFPHPTVGEVVREGLFMFD